MLKSQKVVKENDEVFVETKILIQYPDAADLTDAEMKTQHSDLFTWHKSLLSIPYEVENAPYYFHHLFARLYANTNQNELLSTPFILSFLYGYRLYSQIGPSKLRKTAKCFGFFVGTFYFTFFLTNAIEAVSQKLAGIPENRYKPLKLMLLATQIKTKE